MSLFGQRPSSSAPIGLPEGEVIGSFGNYPDAQKVVDHLSDQQFDVRQISIVGHDLSSVERVTGRLTYPRVAMLSAAQGAMFGLFFGVILAMFGGSGWGLSVLLTVLLGAAFWVILGIVSFAAQRGRRDFTSVSTFVATRYDVVARGDVAGQARQALQGLNLNGLQRGGAPGGFAPGGGYSAPPQGQPGHHPPPPPQQGQYPEYPQPGQPPQGGRPAGPQQPAQPYPGQQIVQPPEQARPAQPQRTPLGEEDLPDGRPRYGVRVEPEQTGPQESTEPGPQEDSGR
ncbi:ECF transporter S component [Kocuria coralli]|uniref:ECF transporter S component n=1 Tax=Kocuria coralli TaxID=1461025 RepID=A0A5J5L119_9MICC|nr:general stress protein [Kocuria coralli]KAA9395543.1 ECF transporter S component [Kocuria coralli]